MEFSDVLRVVSRYKREKVSFRGRSADWETIVEELRFTYLFHGAHRAMVQAKTIAAAFRNLRVHRSEARTQELRREADRKGLRYV